MTITTDMEFSVHGAYDDRIVIGVAVNNPAGRHMTRDSQNDVAHNEGQEVPHPSLPGVLKSGEHHILVKGGCSIVSDLNAAVTAEQVQGYLDHFESNDENMRDANGAVLSYNATDHQLTVSYDVEFGQPNWRVLPMLWVPKTDVGSINFTGESNSLLCFTRVDGEPSAWTIRYRDVQAGQSADLAKDGNICYMIFSEPVTVGSQTLDAFVAYKITSSSISISATNDTKVVRLHRD